MPKVSVIMPVYNPNKWLDEAVRSVMAQTYKNFEIMIVDDGSTKGIDIIFRQMKFGDKVKILRHQTNLNQATALNTGLLAAEGEYICFLDYDDKYYVDKLIEQVNFLDNNPDIDMVYGGGIYIDEQGHKIEDYKLNDNPANLLLWNCICVGSVMIRKKVFDKVSLFDSSLNRSHDWDMWIRVYKANFNIIKMNDNFICYRKHSGQKSTLIDPEEAHEYIRRKHDLK